MGVRLTLASRGGQFFTKHPLPWRYVMPHVATTWRTDYALVDANDVQIVRDSEKFMRYFFVEPYAYALPQRIIDCPAPCSGMPPIFQEYPLPWTANLIDGSLRYAAIHSADYMTLYVWDTHIEAEPRAYMLLASLAEIAYPRYKLDTSSRGT